jgi:hypothetical protein
VKRSGTQLHSFGLTAADPDFELGDGLLGDAEQGGDGGLGAGLAGFDDEGFALLSDGEPLGVHEVEESPVLGGVLLVGAGFPGAVHARKNNNPGVLQGSQPRGRVQCMTTSGPAEAIIGSTIRYPTCRRVGTTRTGVPGWSDPVRVLTVHRFNHGGAMLRYQPVDRDRDPGDLVLLPAGLMWHVDHDPGEPEGCGLLDTPCWWCSNPQHPTDRKESTRDV